MNNGESLSADYYEIFVKCIKNYYMPLKIFGIWFFMLSCGGAFGFLFSFFTDENYNSGLFELPVFKWILILFSLPFIGGLVFLTYKLMMLPVKNLRKVENREFQWKIGTLTYKNISRRNKRGYVRIDDETVICLNITTDEWANVDIGDNFVVLCMKNNAKFAIRA